MDRKISDRDFPEPEMEDWVSILKGLDREEIQDVFSQVFCGQCQLALHTRLQAVANGKLMKKLSISDSSTSLESSTSSNASWGPKQTPESVFSEQQKSYITRSEAAGLSSKDSEGMSEEQKEKVRFSSVVRKKNFVYMERVGGKQVNVLQGLELHTRVFDAEEQKKIVESVYAIQRMGQKGQLRERTYSEPARWMRGKGRVTMQFGCCYNYAVDKKGNPPGIMRAEEVDPLPPVFKQMIKRMVRWHVLPPTCIPNSCIVNVYDEGDCIPPHIDHHDFLRPFCTVSFLSECNILFGANLKILGPGEFSGPASIPLPTGSVLVLNGNGAEIAKHCVPGVPAKRISITFRKMDESKIPYSYSPDPELQGIRPLVTNHLAKASQQNQVEKKALPEAVAPRVVPETSSPFVVEEKDFPPLGISISSRQGGQKKNVSRA